MIQKLVCAFTLMLVVIGASGDSIRTSSPEKQGMSSERLERLMQKNQEYVDDGKVAGVITLVNRGGRLVHTSVAGNRGVDDPRPLEIDHLFRIYSMSKPITAVAAMQLYEQGKFSLNDPISKFVPELKDLKVQNADGSLSDANKPITMHHLLTHTAGFSYGFDPKDDVDQLYRKANLFASKDLTHFAEQLAKLPLRYQPGERWHYSVASDVLGLVVERISGVPFDQYLEENIFQPLGMSDTFFSVPADKMDRFLPNHFWNRKEKKLGTIGSDTPGALARFVDTTLYSGGGGLVSTSHDYMRFAEMLRNGGSLKGVQILSPKTLNYMTKNHLSDQATVAGSGEQPLNQAFKGMGFGLGFGIIERPVEMRSTSSKGAFMWGGAAGTVFWVDPVEDIVVVSMIQLMGSPWSLREDMRIATYQAITESYEK